MRETQGVRVARARENVFEVTATGQELSALVAGARLALDVMHAAPDPPPTRSSCSSACWRDFDRARDRLVGAPPGDG